VNELYFILSFAAIETARKLLLKDSLYSNDVVVQNYLPAKHDNQTFDTDSDMQQVIMS